MQCLQVRGFAILVQTTEQIHLFSIFLVPFLEPVRTNSFFSLLFLIPIDNVKLFLQLVTGIIFKQNTFFLF